MTEPSQFSVATADGAVLQAIREGSGPALMLVSGLGGTAGFWAESAAMLAGRCEVIRFDQRGIGGSTRGTAACDIAQLACDVLAVLDAAQLEQCAVLGHSTGGCIAQSVAAQAPGRVSGLILSATWLKPSHYMTGLFSTRRVMLEQNPEGYAAMGVILAFPPDWLEANWTHYKSAVARAPGHGRGTGDRARTYRRPDGVRWKRKRAGAGGAADPCRGRCRRHDRARVSAAGSGRRLAGLAVDVPGGRRAFLPDIAVGRLRGVRVPLVGR